MPIGEISRTSFSSKGYDISDATGGGFTAVANGNSAIIQSTTANISVYSTTTTKPSGYYIGINSNGSGSEASVTAVYTIKRGYFNSNTSIYISTKYENNGSSSVYIPIKSASYTRTGGRYSAVTAYTSVYVSQTSSNMDATTSSGGYYFAASITANAKAFVNASASASISVSEGYTTGISANTSISISSTS